MINFLVLLYGGITPGFNLANSIALFTASIAISGTFYSSHKSDIRNREQNIAAEKRLKDQLIFHERQSAMLKIYKELYIHKKSRQKLTVKHDDVNNYPAQEFSILSTRYQLFSRLKIIQEDIDSFYYFPIEIRTEIDNFIKYVNEQSDHNPKPITFGKSHIREKLIIIYNMVEVDIQMGFDRDYNVMKPPLAIQGL
jgi:hypothetical protein